MKNLTSTTNIHFHLQMAKVARLLFQEIINA